MLAFPTGEMVILSLIYYEILQLLGPNRWSIWRSVIPSKFPNQAVPSQVPLGGTFSSWTEEFTNEQGEGAETCVKRMQRAWQSGGDGTRYVAKGKLSNKVEDRFVV